jgi:hypothetical protein
MARRIQQRKVKNEKEESMCPACLANLALLAVGATSAGGVTALIVKKLCSKTNVGDVFPTTQTEGEQNENQK